MRSPDALTRLAIVLDHPVQHFSPAFRELAASPVVDTTVFYWNTADGGYYDQQFARTIEWDVDLFGGYHWWAPRQVGTRQERAIATWRSLSKISPDALLLFGWATPNVVIALLWNLFHRRRVFFYGDSTWQHQRAGFLGFVRRWVIRWLFKRAAGAVATGTFNREFYIANGMHPTKVAAGNCPADIAFYTNPGLGSSGRDRLRSAVVIGCAGKLIPIKGVDELLYAASLLLDLDDWELHIIGDGPLRRDLESLASHLGLEARVTFVGFKNQSEMPAALAECDVLAVPSKIDRRALIVTEAMAAGCAVVVSSNTAVWGPGDMVEHGSTGLVYDSGNVLALAGHLRRLITDKDLTHRLVAEASSRLHQQGPETFAQSVEAAVHRRG